MIELGNLIHTGSVACTVAINALGVSIANGIVCKASLDATTAQPSARNEITRTLILGMALAETAAILGLTMGILMLLAEQQRNYYAQLADLGIVLALCLPGFLVGIASAYPAKEACFAIARQPFFDQKIFQTMFITQSIIQTPVIFGFLIAATIQKNIPFVTTLEQALQLIAAGLALGLGSVGPIIGLALFAATALKSLGINRDIYQKVLSFTLMSQAIIETPIIFTLIITLSILTSQLSPDHPEITALGFLASALCIGLSTLMPGISSGKASSIACEQMAYNPESYTILSRLSVLGQGLIDTAVIYALVISYTTMYMCA